MRVFEQYFLHIRAFHSYDKLDQSTRKSSNSKVNRVKSPLFFPLKSLETQLDNFSNGLDKFSNGLERLETRLEPQSFREPRIEFRVSSFEGLSTYLWAVL